MNRTVRLVQQQPQETQLIQLLLEDMYTQDLILALPSMRLSIKERHTIHQRHSGDTQVIQLAQLRMPIWP